MNAPIFSRVTRKKVCILIFNSEIGKRNKQEVLHSADGKVKKMLKNRDVSEFITKNLVIHQLESLIRLLLVTKLLELFIISAG